MRLTLCVSRPALVGLLFLFNFHASAQNDLSSMLMNSTFQIAGPAQNGGTSSGTVFILGKPMKNDPTKGAYVLITAAHVLDDFVGDDALLRLRKKAGEGVFEPYPIRVKIRNLGQPLYKKHPDADVAAMYVSIPSDANITLLSTLFLADDARLTSIEVHPGDELLCLGFPLSIDFNTFPVIRSGILASYPLTPTKITKTFYYNFHIFPGNSGGPVYFTFPNRVYGGGTHIGLEQGVLGLVSQQLNSNAPGYTSSQMDIAKIVPSSFIIDTIALLPESTTAAPTSFNTSPPEKH